MNFKDLMVIRWNEEDLFIPPTFGKEFSDKKSIVFRNDDCLSDLLDYGMVPLDQFKDRIEKCTPQQNVEVYKLCRDATLLEVFSSLSSDVRKLCLTQSQIISFVEKYRTCLHNPQETFFLFEFQNELFVFGVNSHRNYSLSISIYRFGFAVEKQASRFLQVVVPKLF